MIANRQPSTKENRLIDSISSGAGVGVVVVTAGLPFILDSIMLSPVLTEKWSLHATPIVNKKNSVPDSIFRVLNASSSQALAWRSYIGIEKRLWGCAFNFATWEGLALKMYSKLRTLARHHGGCYDK